jgi:hypothetical protein
MTWSAIPFQPTHRALRQFAAAWLVFFLGVGAYQYLARGHHFLGLALGLVAVLLGGLGLVKPPAVRLLFVASMVLAFPIGWLVSQLLLLVMFYVVITPVALFFRLRGRDPLSRKPMRGCDSLWTPKEMPPDVQSYFRQY